MSTDPERGALTNGIAVILDGGERPEGPTPNNLKIAKLLVAYVCAAGWMPRPEPGSPAEDAMVERCWKAWHAEPDGYVRAPDDWRRLVRDGLRAALGTGDAS